MTGVKSDDTALSTLPAYWQGFVGRDDHIPLSGISQNYLRQHNNRRSKIKGLFILFPAVLIQ